MFGYGYFAGHDEWLLYGGGAFGLGMVCLLMAWVVSARLRCPLCTMPVFQNRRCSKHRNAKPLFGSYRLKVAMTVLFQGRFRCPYCGEPTGMVARDRRSGMAGR